MESASKGRIIARFPIFHLQHLHAIGQNIEHLMAVHPTQALIRLHSFPSDVFGPDIQLRASRIIIGLYTDHLTRRRFHLQIRCRLAIIGQAAIERITRWRLPDLDIRLQSIILP